MGACTKPKVNQNKLGKKVISMQIEKFDLKRLKNMRILRPVIPHLFICPKNTLHQSKAQNLSKK